MMAIMKTNVKMMTMMMDENIATCGGAGLGECPLAVQTEAGIPSTIQIQPPLPSDKDDDGDDDNTNDDVLRMMITIMLMIVMLMVVVTTITMVMKVMVMMVVIMMMLIIRTRSEKYIL